MSRPRVRVRRNVRLMFFATRSVRKANADGSERCPIELMARRRRAGGANGT